MRRQIENILHRAGELLLRAENIHAEEKSGRADLVTQFDRSIQDFLERELLALYPQAGFLGEENARENLERRAVFIVDPIDGTTNFVRDFHHSCISAALEIDGAVRCGVQGKTTVFLPAIARADAAAQQTRDLLGRVYHGSLSLLVSAMTQQQALPQAEIDELYALLRDMEEKQRHD